MEEQQKRQLAFTNYLLFETPGGLRFTQDSPILPNVWLAFAKNPHEQQEMILTIHKNGGTGRAANQLREMLNTHRQKKKASDVKAREPYRVAYIPGQIAVRLYFDELMCVVLPLTTWWHKTYDKLRILQHTLDDEAEVADWYDFPKPDKSGKREQDFLEALMLMRRDIAPDQPDRQSLEQGDKRSEYIRDISPDLAWMLRIAGLLANCFLNKHDLLDKKDKLGQFLEEEFRIRKNSNEPDQIDRSKEKTQAEQKSEYKKALKHRKQIVSAFTNLYEGWLENTEYPTEQHIWRITKNRPIQLAVNKSALTVKADAARHLFNISCKDITWAVIDSGIDSAHHAFKQHSAEHEKEMRKKIDKARDEAIENGEEPKREENELRIEDLECSRVIKTLDFTRLRELLDFDSGLDSDSQETKQHQQKIIDEIARRMPNETDVDKKQAAKDLLDELQRRIKDGKDISWQDLECAIVDHDPQPPTNDHGTHVAGILGADWIEEREQERKDALHLRTRRMQGVCPDINLIDVRVFRSDGLTDEFELLAAVQYLRWMNSRAGAMKVHGANLSLSLIHEVRRFACGQTPICDECNEAVAAGMVMVAAAGNRGFEMTDFEEIRSTDSYRSVSITDPGNAKGVITVGATHRKRPHEYGVSYFSSRGPTGDGRLKPDIVAPGEKISGPTPNNRAEYKDGTSMAAPHVSGAAALLMARHKELIAQPERVKRILCETATDLERERYFQGHGLVDVLRALQSI